MRLAEFISELQKAGWEGVSDAQHESIEALHSKIFPSVASLEDELNSALTELGRVWAEEKTKN